MQKKERRTSFLANKYSKAPFIYVALGIRNYAQSVLEKPAKKMSSVVQFRLYILIRYCLWYLLIKKAETEVFTFLIKNNKKKKKRVATTSGKVSYTFFIVIFLNKYKLLDHYNASTALDVCKLHLYKAMCLCVCVFLFYKELFCCSAREKENKNKTMGLEGVRGSLWLSQPLPFLYKKKLNPKPRWVQQPDGWSLFLWAWLA